MRLYHSVALLSGFFQQESAFAGTDAGRDAAVDQKLCLVFIRHGAEQQDRAVNAGAAHGGGLSGAGGGEQMNAVVNKLPCKLHRAQAIAVCLDRSDDRDAPHLLFHGFDIIGQIIPLYDIAHGKASLSDTSVLNQ